MRLLQFNYCLFSPGKYAVKCKTNQANHCVFLYVCQRVLQIGGMTVKHSRSIHHSPVWRSPLIPIVVEQTVSETAELCSERPCSLMLRYL